MHTRQEHTACVVPQLLHLPALCCFAVLHCSAATTLKCIELAFISKYAQTLCMCCILCATYQACLDTKSDQRKQAHSLFKAQYLQCSALTQQARLASMRHFLEALLHTISVVGLPASNKAPVMTPDGIHFSLTHNE